MNLHTTRRKGQSAIEYLSTYGWALLAILVVVGAIMQMGVLNPCSQQTPRFVGQGATVSDWAFTGTNSLDIVVEPSNSDITLTAVNVTLDNGNFYEWTGSQTINQGSTYTASVATGTEFSAGECMKAGITLTYDTNSITSAKATGEGNLQGTAPA